MIDDEIEEIKYVHTWMGLFGGSCVGVGLPSEGLMRGERVRICS